MKLTGIVRILLMLSFLGVSALIYAQDPRDNANPPQEPRPEATKPAGDDVRPPRQDEAKPPKQDDSKPPREEGKPANQEVPKQAEGREQSSAHAQQSGRIPDDKFRAHFGRQHTLVIKQPTVV